MTKRRNHWDRVLCIAVFVLGVLVPGCRQQPIDPGFARADTHAGDIGQKVSDAATHVTGSGQEIISTATSGRDATPQEVRPRLDPYWLKLIASGQFLLVQGDALVAVRRDVDSLRTEVQAGQSQLRTTLSDLQSEKAGRAQDNKAWEDKLATANGKWESGFRTISWLAIVSIGVSVALGFMLHDFRISVAGGAGGLAVVVACMLVGQIQLWLPWVAGGLVVVVVLWVVIEARLRGSLWDALRSNPVQDVQDLLHPQPVMKGA